EILRLHPQTVVVLPNAAQPVPISNGDVQRLIGSEEDASGQISRRFPCIGNEDLAHISQGGILQPTTSHDQRVTTLPPLRIGKVDEPVFRKPRMDSDPVQRVGGLWRSTLRFPNWSWIKDTITNDTQPPGTFRNEHRATIWQKRDAPRMDKPLR